MRLYYAPGACSLAPHIVAREAALPVELEKVDLGAKRTERGEDFRTINPKGYVPTLKLDDGSILTENAAILQFLGDQAGESAGLIPAAGTPDRYRLIEWLTFISTELHKGFSPLFNPVYPEEARALVKAKLAERFRLLEDHFGQHAYLFGDRFSVADAYLFTVLNWSKHHAIDMQPYPHLQAFQARIGRRPAVQKALDEEGLLEKTAV